MKLDEIQKALREQRIDAWLFYDHHHRDPIGERILGLDREALVSRRWYYVVPADGEPRKLVHRIESGRLDAVPGRAAVYSSWQELEAGLRAMLVPFQRIAMQYSPRNAIMYVSMVDAGTVELLREMGKQVVSSADLVSRFEAILSEEQIASHYAAQRAIDGILEEGFREIGRRTRPAAAGATTLTEYDMVLWFQEAMGRAGLVWEHPTNVSVNQNSADSHYEATAGGSKPIRDGDFLLIDIWGREDRPGTCFYDITWTGVIGRAPSDREQQVFQTVAKARDAAVSLVESAFTTGVEIAGWQADDAARSVIRDAGFGEYFTHRTGHNIASEIHGNGAHLDNLETHDERLLLPFTCFSVEPGIYLPEFGIRSEVNMMTSANGAVVTGRVQHELLRI
ncbi:MAG TPA: M24 family metallopeptidase [Acidisarcina sp.]